MRKFRASVGEFSASAVVMKNLIVKRKFFVDFSRRNDEKTFFFRCGFHGKTSDPCGNFLSRLQLIFLASIKSLIV